MYTPGQQVMITGDALAACGALVTVKSHMMCELQDKVVPIYEVEPAQVRDGMKLLFQEHHLMPLGEHVVLQDMLAEIA